MKAPSLVIALALVTSALAQDAPPAATDPHAAGVDTRGDHSMGFSHEISTHHFRLLTDGGAIEVTANNPRDTTTQDQIRMHLSHIAQMFVDGNFKVPMFIHDAVPPGVPVMKAKRAAIAYVFEPISGGGRVHISSKDADAIKAIHQFLIFQIEDHRTGDSETVLLPRAPHS